MTRAQFGITLIPTTGGPQKNAFVIQGNTCPASLNAGSSCTVTAFFAPAAIESAMGGILVANTEAGSPNTIVVVVEAGIEGLADAAVAIADDGSASPQYFYLSELAK